jgi:class 3 adenylate cyclase
MDSTHQSEICTIFIDIVNSTDTIRRLSPELTNKTITMFIGDVMRTLLMYDITIDKFLGDGVLAFSNDPVMQKDYVERVIDAALEIRELILSKRSQYSENWGQPLDIRIGIAVGKANVGFYGREEYVRSYTAIGEVVNLASRICLHAQPNQVLISEACAHRLPMGLYSISPVGAKNLKGFGTESVPVFSVSESHRRSKMTHNSSMCPSGHGVLHLATDDAGIYVLMCRVCGYSLQNLSGSDVPSSKKAA